MFHGEVGGGLAGLLLDVHAVRVGMGDLQQVQGC